MPRYVCSFLLAAVGSASIAQAQAPAMPVGFGPQPVLPAPETQLIPTVNVAPVQRWTAAQRPFVAAGLAIQAYARDLDHPRWLYVLPNGDVLVAETNAPPKPDDSKGIKGAIMQMQMKKAGAATPSANRITLLRGMDGNGVAQTRSVFLQGLHSPFGMALVGKELYVANADALLRFPYEEGQTAITAPGTKVMDLPGGPINHHWTKNVIASPDGKFLYVSVGSNSNVGENGMSAEDGRAAIWRFERATGKARVYATGLRNPNGMGWEPKTNTLWTAVNERDELGNDLVPDYMTSVKDGAFYGWPYSYFGQHVDARVKPPQPGLVARAVAPDYALGAHTASLGLAFYTGTLLPERYRDGVFIGQHGSWNRKPFSGYKVIFVPFANGVPSGPPQDVVSGFLDKDGHAQGRPVGVAIDKAGALLVADDVGNVIWRVAPAR
ncbi:MULTISPECIES: sorbosone dehydrogenase family protein [unclassified Janthinobacterium]|uniref:PQQ-dependent sugar dehydrogenase n=1 Tax=unclassified Janthinobacterium TaxID=2610881 RepID=UPI00087F1DBD|nr:MULTISPECIES: sorbosone dehydrogenase family protein [unclassified Janthinobacterium]SDA50216.1 Glucose/arabinose dehydrogenase, beta-propeller fold [Janthinobacterium sp. 551a]SFB43299.1 Glucose/arabinose dehydrogenase, beta-propeller fold [Janthinobacterium sp. 344]